MKHGLNDLENVAEVCAITGQPAKYREPRTGLAYSTPAAFRQLRTLANGQLKWSELLGCYIGTATRTARGVPERFWQAG